MDKDELIEYILEREAIDRYKNPVKVSEIDVILWLDKKERSSILKKLIADTENLIAINTVQMRDYDSDDPWREILQDNIDGLLKKKARYKSLLPGKKATGSSITDEDIQKARCVPIDSLLQFNNNGFTCCPFHNEKTPSLKLYKGQNHAYCFGCSKSIDSIAIVMHLKGIDFISAVKYLIGI